MTVLPTPPSSSMVQGVLKKFNTFAGMEHPVSKWDTHLENDKVLSFIALDYASKFRVSIKTKSALLT